MKRIALVVPLLVGCPARAPVVPTTTAPPAASTACYAGVSKGIGQSARTIARRTVDPAAHQIIEDVTHDEAGSQGSRSFHVVMDVDGDRFTMKETGGAFTGSGTLVGEPWQWTAWTSISTIPNTGIEVSSDDELTSTGMKATKEIRKAGKVLASTVEELKTFDCAEWDKYKAALAVPVLDAAACERACRNYATLKYWETADAEIAGLPVASRDEARQKKAAGLTEKLEVGLPTCVTQCTTANNPAQTACMGAAKTVDAIAACDQE